MAEEVYNFGKWTVARIVCLPALIMPYKVRIEYISLLSKLTHIPFYTFGTLARFLIQKLHISFPEPKTTPPKSVQTTQKHSVVSPSSVAVLYSGGTDSTCTAALMADQFKKVHLLTFYEHATRFSPVPHKNIALLGKRFPKTDFEHAYLSVDKLVKYFWYENYLKHLRENGFLVLSTCGFSTLSWHVRVIIYCLEHNITQVADGLTRELLHFPGHMDPIIHEFKHLYKTFGITYKNPVREYPVPEDQQFIDKLIVNRHGGEYVLGDTLATQRKTTGQYLYSIGLFEKPNLKGSRKDFDMQHDCYPFALYNILAFWGYLSVEPYESFSERVHKIMKEKTAHAKHLIDSYTQSKEKSSLHLLLQP